ncbi:MAG: hypothetical protein NT062_22715 [Proteobacteria bacterium]|nr:hypothetical protein [Pseudomonadota bacterium]
MVRSLIACWVAMTFAGCHDDAAVTPKPIPDAPDPQWGEVSAHYGRLLPIAGVGATDSRVNEWLPGFEGGDATAAELSRPHFAMADGAGNVFIADKEAHAIRKVAVDGKITTYAGTGLPDPLDDSPGPATMRALGDPNGLFVRPDGTLYILDLDHGRIRKVATDRTMTTLVTIPTGIVIGRGLWVDDGGVGGTERVYIASNTLIRRWTAATGVTTWASGFGSLGNLAMDADGHLLVSDRGASRIYLMTEDASGVVRQRVVAGNGQVGDGVDGAKAVATPMSGLRAVWPAHPGDGGGFFAGTHEGCQLWFVDAKGIAHVFLDGKKDAHAGNGEPFDSPGAKVSELRSVSLDAAGNVYVVDDDRGFVRMVERK